MWTDLPGVPLLHGPLRHLASLVAAEEARQALAPLRRDLAQLDELT